MDLFGVGEAGFKEVYGLGLSFLGKRAVNGNMTEYNSCMNMKCAAAGAECVRDNLKA